MVTVTDDYSNIDEPKTNREMYQKIIHMIQEDRDDRQEDRELLEKFIAKQDTLNDAMKKQFDEFKVCITQHDERITTLKEQSKKWDVTNFVGLIIAGVLAALGIKS